MQQQNPLREHAVPSQEGQNSTENKKNKPPRRAPQGLGVSCVVAHDSPVCWPRKPAPTRLMERHPSDGGQHPQVKRSPSRVTSITKRRTCPPKSREWLWGPSSYLDL